MPKLSFNNLIFKSFLVAIATTANAEESMQSFSRDDLTQKAPVMGEHFLSPLKNHTATIVNHLANDSATNLKLISTNEKLRKKENQYFLKQATMQTDFEDPSTGGLVSRDLQSSSKRALGKRVNDVLPFMASFKSGVKFKMNFSSLFSKSQATEANPQPLRYGLVLQDIEPSVGVLQASTGPISPEELSYAAKAKVSWGIGPIDRREEEERLFNVAGPNANDSTENSWLPDPNFNGAISQRDDAAAAEMAGSGLPPMRLGIEQTQSLYRFEYLTKNNFKKDQLTHAFSCPLVQKLRATQQFDERLKMKRSSFENVLVREDQPSLNLHYLNQEKRYQSDLLYVKNGYTVTFTADTPKGFQPLDDFGSKKGERYEVKLQTAF